MTQYVIARRSKLGFGLSLLCGPFATPEKAYEYNAACQPFGESKEGEEIYLLHIVEPKGAATAEPRPAPPQMRPFRQSEWDAFCGAERWVGMEPHYAEVEACEAMVIAAKGFVEVHFTSGASYQLAIPEELPAYVTIAVAQGLVNDLYGVQAFRSGATGVCVDEWEMADVSGETHLTRA